MRRIYFKNLKRCEFFTHISWVLISILYKDMLWSKVLFRFLSKLVILWISCKNVSIQFSLNQMSAKACYLIKVFAERSKIIFFYLNIFSRYEKIWISMKFLNINMILLKSYFKLVLEIGICWALLFSIKYNEWNCNMHIFFVILQWRLKYMILINFIFLFKKN